MVVQRKTKVKELKIQRGTDSGKSAVTWAKPNDQFKRTELEYEGVWESYPIIY